MLDGFAEQLRPQLTAGQEGQRTGRRGVPRRRPLLAISIARIVAHLEAAIAFAPAPTAAALEALVRFYRTGEIEERRRYDIAWVADNESTVDTINGFIEVYMDARGAKGAWESLVYYVHPEKTAAVRAIADHAQWFEDRMPWHPQWRKPQVTGVSARAIEVIVEAGDSGPMTPIGINLPNDQEIRETLRQQVGLALERRRGLREVDAARVPQRVLVERGRSRSAPSAGARSRRS